LSKKDKNGEIPIVLIPSARSWFSLYMQVPSGCVCLAQSWGKDMGQMDPGLHIVAANWKVAYVVSTQACTYDAPVREAPTSDNVRVGVDVTIVFKISDASKFIYRLGAPNFDSLLSGTVDEAIRMLVRQQDCANVYSLRGEKAGEMLKILRDSFKDTGVEFISVLITTVWLPPDLAHYLEETTKIDKGLEKKKRENEYEMLNIKMASEMAIEEISRRADQVLVTEAGKMKRAELNFEQNSVKAEEDARVALIEAEATAEVEMVKQKAKLERTKIQLESKHVRSVADAEAEAENTRMQAELAEEKATIEAQWQECEMLSDAQIIKYDASAEKEATRNMAALRKHELDLREKHILKDLAMNGNFNLVGTAGDKLISSMMSGSFQR